MIRIQRSDNATRTQPTDEPVSVAEVKLDQRIQYPDHDGLIRDLIQAARQHIEEQMLWKALLTQTCIDKFPTFGGEFELAWEPVQSTDLVITYQDVDNATQTLSTDVYELANRNGAGIVRLKYNQTWPSTLGHADSVTITYVAGYGDDAEDVPITIRQAIRVLAGSWLENPDGGMAVPLQVDGLLSGQAAMRILA